MGPSRIVTVDYHTGGEPFRIVPDPPVAIPGATVAERRARAIEDADVQALRAVLCWEPRGHADMYGGFVVPPDDAGAHLGVLFWHKDGFSTACGHGTIALGVWAVDTGLERLQDALADLAGRDLDDLCDELLARMLPAEVDDDVALIALRLHPQDRLRPAEAGPNRIPENVDDAPAVIARTH